MKMEKNIKNHNFNNSDKKIAIVGGGVAGIITCKFAVEMGFQLSLFEQRDELLGNWNMESKVWPNLITNISKFFTQFSDFIWHDTDNIFPNKTQMNNFITKYVEEFEIEKYVKFNTKVVNIELMSDKRFNVKSEYIKSKIRSNEIFDFVVVCSGNYAEPSMINISALNTNNKSSDEIEIIHSKDYKYPDSFKNKRVMIVGNSHSGVEISSEVSKSCQSLVNVYLKPVWVLPKFIYSPTYDKILPYDIANSSRKNMNLLKSITPDQAIKAKNILYSTMSEQNSINKNLYIGLEVGKFPGISISSSYVEDVKRGLIIPEIGSIVKIQGKNVTLTNGKVFEIDTIILCTGFNRDYSFLDKQILERIKYDPTKYDSDQVKLKYNIFNPDLNIAFIAVTKGTFFMWELQARVALNFFLGKLKINQDGENCENISNNIILNFEILARLLGIEPNLELIKISDPELYEIVINGPMLPQHYSLGDLTSQANKKSLKYIKKVNKDLRRGNFIAKF